MDRRAEFINVPCSSTFTEQDNMSAFVKSVPEKAPFPMYSIEWGKLIEVKGVFAKAKLPISVTVEGRVIARSFNAFLKAKFPMRQTFLLSLAVNGGMMIEDTLAVFSVQPITSALSLSILRKRSPSEMKMPLSSSFLLMKGALLSLVEMVEGVRVVVRYGFMFTSSFLL